MTKKLPKVRQSGFVTQELENEILIYNLTTHKAHCLNTSMSHIWSFCNGESTTTQVIDSFRTKLKVNINEDFIWLAVDELIKADLIEDASRSSLRFKNQISRRNALVHIALPVAMLPIIVGIVAPTAAHAASDFCLPGDPNFCTDTSQCAPISVFYVCNTTSSCCGAPNGGGGSSGGGDDCTMDCG